MLFVGQLRSERIPFPLCTAAFPSRVAVDESLFVTPLLHAYVVMPAELFRVNAMLLSLRYGEKF